MDEEKSLCVEGFRFGTKEDMELAEQEISAIRYLEKKLENRNGETILSVYQATLEKRVFRTPIGYTYLKSLQRKMIQMGIKKERIPEIPLYQVFNDSYKTTERRIRTVSKPKKDENIRKFRYSLLLNVVLVILVFVLFAISLNGKHPNILNYRNNIENEYASWEQELQQREQQIRKLEQELGISYED